MRTLPKRVLCIDDEEDILSMLSSLLGLLGCEVETAATFREGVEKAAASHFDLFILDHWLPGGSGADLCRSLRNSAPGTPVLFYTASAYDSDRQAALDAGAHDYLVKPTDIGRLADTVRRLLQ